MKPSELTAILTNLLWLQLLLELLWHFAQLVVAREYFITFEHLWKQGEYQVVLKLLRSCEESCYRAVASYLKEQYCCPICKIGEAIKV